MKSLQNFILGLHRSGYIKIIEKRLKKFELIFEKGGDKEIFFELVYCLLTAQTSFYRALSSVAQMKKMNVDFTDSESIKNILKSNSIRFYNNKTKYINEAATGFGNIKSILSNIPTEFEKREWLVTNIKGFGYKESSHFLRNIGFGSSLAILDRHIIRMLYKFNFILEPVNPSSKAKYLKLEDKFLCFTKDLSITPDVADFVLFAYSKAQGAKLDFKTFSILKELK